MQLLVIIVWFMKAFILRFSPNVNGVLPIGCEGRVRPWQWWWREHCGTLLFGARELPASGCTGRPLPSLWLCRHQDHSLKLLKIEIDRMRTFCFVWSEYPFYIRVTFPQVQLLINLGTLCTRIYRQSIMTAVTCYLCFNEGYISCTSSPRPVNCCYCPVHYTSTLRVACIWRWPASAAECEGDWPAGCSSDTPTYYIPDIPTPSSRAYNCLSRDHSRGRD